jgi:hypothetical protein
VQDIALVLFACFETRFSIKSQPCFSACQTSTLRMKRIFNIYKRFVLQNLSIFRCSTREDCCDGHPVPVHAFMLIPDLTQWIQVDILPVHW